MGKSVQEPKRFEESPKETKDYNQQDEPDLFVTELPPPKDNNPGYIIKDKDADDYSDIE